MRSCVHYLYSEYPECNKCNSAARASYNQNIDAWLSSHGYSDVTQRCLKWQRVLIACAAPAVARIHCGLLRSSKCNFCQHNVSCDSVNRKCARRQHTGMLCNGMCTHGCNSVKDTSHWGTDGKGGSIELGAMTPTLMFGGGAVTLSACVCVSVAPTLPALEPPADAASLGKVTPVLLFYRCVQASRWKRSRG